MGVRIRHASKLRKTTISFVISLCLSVCLFVRLPLCKENLVFHWMEFYYIFTSEHFSKICKENSIFIKNLRMITGTWLENLCIFTIILVEFFLELEMFRRIIIENIKLHISWLVAYFWKDFRLRDNIKKIWCSRTDYRWQHGECALYAGWHFWTIII